MTINRLASLAFVAALLGASAPAATLTFHVALNDNAGKAYPAATLAGLYASLKNTGPVTRREERGAWIDPKGNLKYDDNENVQVTVPASQAVAIATAFLTREKRALAQEYVLAEIYPAANAPGNKYVAAVSIVSLDVDPCSVKTRDADLASLSKIAGGASAYQLGTSCRIYSDVGAQAAPAVVQLFNHDKVVVRAGSTIGF